MDTSLERITVKNEQIKLYCVWSKTFTMILVYTVNYFLKCRKMRKMSQGGTPFVDLYVFFLSCVYYAFVRVCLYVPCGHLLGKGWPLGSRLWCLTGSLSLSHCYPGSGVVLDCIDSWSLHPYLLLKKYKKSFLGKNSGIWCFLQVD